MELRAIDWRGLVRSPLAVLAAWAAYALVRLLVQPLLGWDPVDTDDWMRLEQVRDWLAGQSWWDVTQYRMNPPDGFSMHWSRLVDLPLAGAILLLGEPAALALVPLLWLLPALFGLRAIALRLGLGPLALAFTLLLLPLFPLLPGNFAPLRIDHHTPQAVLGLVCAALLLSDRRAAALAAGLCAAAWLAISLEGLPLVAVLAALYGLRYWFGEQRLLPWFLLALTVSAAALTLATRPLASLAGYCDVLLPGHIAAFGAATLAAALIPLLPLQQRAPGRLAALALVPLLALPTALVQLGPCAANPMAALDPLLQSYWHGYITEGLPVWRQDVPTAMMLVWPIPLVMAAWWIAGRSGRFDQGRALAWTLLAGFALAAALYSLWLMRAGVIAQLLALPFAAFLLAHFLPRARAIPQTLPRLGATLACFALATPAFMGALATPLEPLLPRNAMRLQVATLVEGPPCDYSALTALAPAVLFASLDKGAEIVGRTGHSVVAANYHRNQQPMGAVIAAMMAPPAEAETLVRASGADYLVFCPADGSFAMYRAVAPAGLSGRLAEGEVPGWLEPVTGFEESALRVYRIGGKV